MEPIRLTQVVYNYGYTDRDSLSEMLPVLRDEGEGQRVKFIAKYPENEYELSREIAAFVSSNPRTILIGVSETGTLKLINVFCGSGRIRSRRPAVIELVVRPNPITICNRDETVRN